VTRNEQRAETETELRDLSIVVVTVIAIYLFGRGAPFGYTTLDQYYCCILPRPTEVNSHHFMSGLQFKCPVGAQADLKELEYISAIHQTAKFIRKDGSITGTYVECGTH
jgi:hypothetical protein